MIALDYSNFANMLDNLPVFSDFYEFREADFYTFIRKAMVLPEADKIKNSYVWQKRVNEAHDMPVVDQVRMMKAIADELGNKNLKNKILSNFTRELTFQEAINRRLRPTMGASRRTQSGQKPDGIGLQEPLGALVNIGKRMAVLKPLSQDVAQNGSKKGRTGTQPENPIKPIAQPIKAPRAAQEAQDMEMRRTKWPESVQKPEDRIFRLVELPDGMRITQAQNRAELALSCAKSENPYKPIAQPKIAPSAAHGDGPGP